MHTYLCKNNCCKIFVAKCNHRLIHKSKHHKSGMFIYDKVSKKILLVQSNGHLWGQPKGSSLDGENERDCAIREVKEETGLEIQPNFATPLLRIQNNASYYYIEREECKLLPNIKLKDNDANGICWININCLEELIQDGNMSISQHCRICIRKFLNKELPYNTFTICKRKRKRRRHFLNERKS